MYILFIIFKLLNKFKLLGIFIREWMLQLLIPEDYFSKTLKYKQLLKTQVWITSE